MPALSGGRDKQNANDMAPTYIYRAIVRCRVEAGKGKQRVGMHVGPGLPTCKKSNWGRDDPVGSIANQMRDCAPRLTYARDNVL